MYYRVIVFAGLTSALASIIAYKYFYKNAQVSKMEVQVEDQVQVLGERPIAIVRPRLVTNLDYERPPPPSYRETMLRRRRRSF